MKYQAGLILLLIHILLYLTPNHLKSHHHHEQRKDIAIKIDKNNNKGHFLFIKNDSLFFVMENQKIIGIKKGQLPIGTEESILPLLNKIEAVNQITPNHATKPASNIDFSWLFIFMFAIGFGLILIGTKKRWIIGSIFLLGTGFMSFKNPWRPLEPTDPKFVDAAFSPYKPKVRTSWNQSTFFVESTGIADHEMMAGITAWQQQVPIPQCYTQSNAWTIPLLPVPSADPIPVNPDHFTRGAIALACNGIPIFNPYTNTGVDAFLDGQLDRFGGHSGRADDYHYHLAPLHLQQQINGKYLPIAFGLDGYPVYGTLEPDGSAMLPLDENHGHFDNEGKYHYHGSVSAPYMIAKMKGQVVEDADKQLVPQPKATPVRPSTTPLKDAVIQSCRPDNTQNGYSLNYTLNGQSNYVNYQWSAQGKYTYEFVTGGNVVVQEYNGFIPCNLSTNIAFDLPYKNILHCFPNPGTGNFQIECSYPIYENSDVVIIVHNLFGGEILRKKINTKNTLLNINFPGQFFVNMTVNGIFIKQTIKLVVQ